MEAVWEERSSVCVCVCVKEGREENLKEEPKVVSREIESHCI